MAPASQPFLASLSPQEIGNSSVQRGPVVGIMVYDLHVQGVYGRRCWGGWGLGVGVGWLGLGVGLGGWGWGLGLGVGGWGLV